MTLLKPGGHLIVVEPIFLSVARDGCGVLPQEGRLEGQRQAGSDHGLLEHLGAPVVSYYTNEELASMVSGAAGLTIVEQDIRSRRWVLSSVACCARRTRRWSLDSRRLPDGAARARPGALCARRTHAVASAGRALASLRRRLRAQPRRPGGFLGRGGRAIDWHAPPQRVLDRSAPPFYRWFPGAQLNTCHNALDRHVDGGPRRPARADLRQPGHRHACAPTVCRAARRGRAARGRAAPASASDAATAS